MDGSTLDERLEALTAATALIDPELLRLPDDALRYEVTHAVDSLLARIARGHGAIDIALGEGLDAMSIGPRTMQFGYAGIGDYARERLDLPASTAVKMARLSRELRTRPALREAVRSGEITPRKAQTVLRVARGDDEAGWVERSKRQTVRALAAAINVPPSEAPEEDAWTRMSWSVTAEQRRAVDEAMEIAGRLIGATAPRWERLKGLAQEYIGAHGEVAPDAADGAPAEEASAAELLRDWKEWAERENRNWAWLDPVAGVQAPLFESDGDVRDIEQRLRNLLGMRERWDSIFGKVVLFFRKLDGWRALDFISFEHYCAERLGMAESTVVQRANLERVLQRSPSLANALRDKRLSYEKARVLAQHVQGAKIAYWVEQAEKMACIDLRRALEGEAEVQMCARGEFTAVVPRHVRVLLAAAFATCRKVAGRHLTPGECLKLTADNFIETWGPVIAGRVTLQHRIFQRDKGLCRVPGCSRAAAQCHHIEYRSHGGSDDPANLISLCAAHHLIGIHMGWIKVSGEAPNALTWRLGPQDATP